MTLAICHGITKGGTRCRARPLVGSGYCVNHSPDISDDQRAAWRATGGKNSSAKVRARKQLPGALMGADEIGAWLAICFKRVIAEKMDPGVANAVSTMSRAMLAVREASDIEDRLNALEQAMEAQATPTRRYGA